MSEYFCHTKSIFGSEKMKLWLATSNTGKINEIKSLLMNEVIEVHTPKEIKSYFFPEETGATFYDNALIKAKSLHSVCSNDWVLAEDSGLEVEGLKGMPGVYSARYAGDKASDAENTAKVLKMVSIRSPQNRKAQFKCVMVALSPKHEVFTFEGVVKGTLTKAPQGQGGFGYDPIFIPEGESKTFSELGVGFKNKVSHRKQALSLFLEHLKKEVL